MLGGGRLRLTLPTSPLWRPMPLSIGLGLMWLFLSNLLSSTWSVPLESGSLVPFQKIQNPLFSFLPFSLSFHLCLCSCVEPHPLVVAKRSRMAWPELQREKGVWIFSGGCESLLLLPLLLSLPPSLLSLSLSPSFPPCCSSATHQLALWGVMPGLLGEGGAVSEGPLSQTKKLGSGIQAANTGNKASLAEWRQSALFRSQWLIWPSLREKESVWEREREKERFSWKS